MTFHGPDLLERVGDDGFAVFSQSLRYRYILGRHWDASRGTCAFIMLNPSTADENVLDPTVRRCVGFAKSWGYGSLLVGNIFALRSTDPANLYTAHDPVGTRNDEALREIVRLSAETVAAWGVHGALGGRGKKVLDMLGRSNLRSIGLTKDGSPRHPLYARRTAPPRNFEAPA